MKTSTKHDYGIAQSCCSPTAVPATPSQNEWGRPRRATELLRGTDISRILKENRSLLDAWAIPAELLLSASRDKETHLLCSKQG